MTLYLIVAMAVTYDCPRVVGFDLFSKAPAAVQRALCRENAERNVRLFQDRASAISDAKQGEKLYQVVAEKRKLWKREIPVRWVPVEG